MLRIGISCLALALAATLVTPVFAQQAAQKTQVQVQQQPAQGTTVQGQIIRMQNPDQFIVRTKDNKEVTLYANPRTRYTINNKAGRYSDLRVGTNINAVYGVQDDRYIVNSVNVGAPVRTTTTTETVEQPAAPAKATVVEGTVLRIVGKDQVIVRTADNKEVIIYVAPQTKYVVNEQPAQFTDFAVGAPVRVEYDVRERRNTARLFGRRR